MKELQRKDAKAQLASEQPSEVIDTIFRAFCVGATLGLIIGVTLTAAIFTAHDKQHDRMFHAPKQEKGGAS